MTLLHGAEAQIPRRVSVNKCTQRQTQHLHLTAKKCESSKQDKRSNKSAEEPNLYEINSKVMRSEEQAIQVENMIHIQTKNNEKTF